MQDEVNAAELVALRRMNRKQLAGAEGFLPHDGRLAVLREEARRARIEARDARHAAENAIRKDGPK